MLREVNESSTDLAGVLIGLSSPLQLSLPLVTIQLIWLSGKQSVEFPNIRRQLMLCGTDLWCSPCLKSVELFNIVHCTRGKENKMEIRMQCDVCFGLQSYDVSVR